ncbi:MAG: tRNA-binding protein [Candidatus Marsarchaeota archaeon]|nr:tRNA-binding protein [Candidatus Marsarchaeota archaeon]
MTISYGDFEKVDIRIGRIISVEDFKEARKPAYKLHIDFGKEIGIKQSSAQITALYTKEQLINRLVLAVVNFAPKRIADFESEVLTLGVDDNEMRVVLIAPDKDVEPGAKLY